MSEYTGAFLLGNAAILGNVCMLPLYPGLIAFLAGNVDNERVRRGGMLLGTAVLAGVLATMLGLGFVMFALGQSFSRILPCTGPVIVSAFVLGVGSAAALGESLLYFLAFGLGFGWPLVALPLVALPLQRGVTRWLAGNVTVLGRVADVVMLAIAAFGIWVDVVPNLTG